MSKQLPPFAGRPQAAKMLPNSDMVEALLQWNLRAMKAKLLLDARRGAEAEPTLVQTVEAERSRLKSLTYTALSDEFAAMRKAQTHEREASLPFNQTTAVANFDYWCKLDHWTAAETVALLLCKNPDAVSADKLKPLRQLSTFPQVFDDLSRLVERSEALGYGRAAMRPTDVVAWADAIGVTVPDEMRQRLGPVERRESVGTAPQQSAIDLDICEEALRPQYWFKLARVTAIEAALLLAQRDPHAADANAAAEESTWRDCTPPFTPQDYKRLRRAFEDAEALEPGGASLMQWLNRARRAGIRYHPWIDEFVRSASQAEATGSAQEIKYTPVERLEVPPEWSGDPLLRGDGHFKLEEAARFASAHAGRQITVSDILRAGADGQIPVRVVFPRTVVMLPVVGGDKERQIPKGSYQTLPANACAVMSVKGSAMWREYEELTTRDEWEGQLCRFARWKLALIEPDLVATQDDCLVMGWHVQALATAHKTGTAEAVQATEEGPHVEIPVSGRRRTWVDIAGSYMVEKLRSGRFATAKNLYNALHDEANSDDSPFERGQGPNRGHLVVKESGKKLDLKTVQNQWRRLREGRLTD